MNKPETEFVIYMINVLANQKKLYPSQVYKILDETGCIENYLVPFYDVLHTMGSRSVAEDIEEYVRRRGGDFKADVPIAMNAQGSEEFYREHLYREHLEEEIVFCLSDRHKLAKEDALRLYYSSKMCNRIHEGQYGIQYPDYHVLTDY